MRPGALSTASRLSSSLTDILPNRRDSWRKVAEKIVMIVSTGGLIFPFLLLSDLWQISWSPIRPPTNSQLRALREELERMEAPDDWIDSDSAATTTDSEESDLEERNH